jgi:hypothetical protein
MFESALFLRTLSQALQAFLPIAFCSAWAWQSSRAHVSRAMRWSAAAALPATLVAAWLFGQSVQQAKWEAMLATIGLGLAVWFAIMVWRASAPPPRAIDPRIVLLLATAGVIIVIRQTMEIGVVLQAAALEVQSVGAVVTICAGAAAGIIASYTWTWLGRRIPSVALMRATRVFAIMFIAQIALYAVHEAAEAGLLPSSEWLHAATEPYGPDSPFGWYVSIVLLAVPVAVALTTLIIQLLADPIAGVATVGGTVLLSCIVVIVGTNRAESPLADAARDESRPARPAATHDIRPFLHAPRILFRHARMDADYGHLAVAALDAPDGARATVDLECARVSFGTDRGVCIQAQHGDQKRYNAVIIDAAFKPVHTIALEGTFSRTRTSTDDRFGVTTTFLGEQSHGYASVNVSTATTLLDLRLGTTIANLEQFTTVRQGKRFSEADFNFWGVTFARSDSNTFYATLRSAKTNYLVRGDIAQRTMTVIAEDVECPSLSPDERSIAFKRLVSPMAGAWRLYVLDLATMTDRPISAVHSYVDDQVEWLDSGHVLYALPHLGTADVWVAPIDGNEPARILVHDADSPIVVRMSPGTRGVETSAR